ncbi:MAG: aldehyde dehydrogenase [Bacteroidales bacterium]
MITTNQQHLKKMKDYHSIVSNQQTFFKSGKTRDIGFRKAQLKKFLNVLQDNERLLIDAAWKDLHKSEFETYATELGLIYGEIMLAIRKVKKWSKPKSVLTNIAALPATSRIYPEPYGTTLIIGAWNFPFLLILEPLVGALAAGNTIILKPSELAPACSSVLAKILNGAFNPEYLRVVEGAVPETQALLKEKFDYIFFTGSTKVGKIIYKAAAEQLTPVTLELGGKSPCIVDRDFPVKLAAKRIAWGKFINAGQTCIAPDYLLVHREAKDELLKYLKKYIHDFYGENPKNSPDFLRIVNKPNFDRLKELIVPEKVYTGGDTNEKELYISPTILDNVNWADKVMEDEIFGPVLPVLTFDDFFGTIDLLKQKEKPLALYYFGKNKGRQKLILKELNFGGGTFNDGIMHITNARLPFGGIGHSGMGNYHGRHGFETFSHQKSIMKRTTWIDIPLRYPPYKLSTLKIVKKLL